jgi:hypothetical protein
MVNAAVTPMTFVAVPVHPLAEAVTVYVVLTVGEAVTVLPVVALRPAEGAHV